MIINLNNEFTYSEYKNKFYENFKSRNSKSYEIILSNVKISQIINHYNYLEYLNYAYTNHLGVVLTPDILWYTILCELNTVIKSDIKKYKKYFTKSPDKKQIISITKDDFIKLGNQKFIEQFENYIPINIDLFLEEFSTTDYVSKQAMNATFCDAISLYHEYTINGCGIPWIEIDGNQEDYIKIVKKIFELQDIFVDNQLFLESTLNILSNIIKSFDEDIDLDFFKNVFYAEKCDNCHQSKIYGWFSDLFINKPEPRFLCNFPSHISAIPFSVSATEYEDKKFESLYGCMRQRKQRGRRTCRCPTSYCKE